MRLGSVLLVMLIATGGCRTNPASRAQRLGREPAARPDSGATAALLAYVDAAAAGNREKLKTLVLLPKDPSRRQWVLGVIGEGELPPPRTKGLSPIVKMDGPVAVGQTRLRAPDGSIEPSGPAFLVLRDGQWKVVIDFFEGSDLTQEEMKAIGRYLNPR